jgi:hypothetical protein
LSLAPLSASTSTQGLTVEAVYQRAQATLARPGMIYHASIDVEADTLVAYTGTILQWADATRDVAREDAEHGPLGRWITLLAGDGRYTRRPDGSLSTASASTSTCHGIGRAASMVLNRPVSTELSTSHVDVRTYQGRGAVVLVTAGTLRGSDPTVTFTRAYLQAPLSVRVVRRCEFAPCSLRQAAIGVPAGDESPAATVVECASRLRRASLHWGAAWGCTLRQVSASAFRGSLAVIRSNSSAWGQNQFCG